MRPHIARLRIQLAGDRAQQRGLARAVAPDQRDPLGTAQLEAALHTGAVPEPEILEGEDGTPRRHGRVRQVDTDLVVVPYGLHRLVEPLPGLGEFLLMHDAVLARGLLCRPLARPHDDLRLALLFEHLLPVPLAAGQLDLGVGQFALLFAEVGLGDAHHALGRLLFDLQGILVVGVVAAVPGDLPGAEIGDLVDEVQQFPVVTDDDHHTRPGLDGRVQPPARVQVEVVGRLVQQQHIGPAQQQRGQSQQDRLAARDLADGAVQLDVSEPEFAQGGQGTLLDVPVVADGLEVRLGHVARLDGMQRGPLSGDAERLVDAQSGVERDVLREVTDLAGHADGAVGRCELTGDQLQQGRFPGPVDADQAGPARAERDVQALEDGGAVRPGEGEGRDSDGSRHAGLFRGCLMRSGANAYRDTCDQGGGTPRA